VNSSHTQRAKDAFGELLITRIRDPQIEDALARARAIGDDGTAAIAAIDALIAQILQMLEEPTWGKAGTRRSMPLRVLVGMPTEGGDAATATIPVDLTDLVAASDGLVGDLIDWIDRFSKFPQTPAFDPLRTTPTDDTAFRRAVRGVMKELVSGQPTHPALAGIDRLALPPGGAIFPELRESRSADGRSCWIGAIRLFRESPEGRVPLDRVAWIEVLENADHSIEARLINVVESAVGGRPPSPKSHPTR
jgi:hypothetical protein